MGFLNLNEHIKFRIEVNRELKNIEVDDNFRYVANPWSEKRVYQKGMIVYHEQDITPSGNTTTVYALYWFVANKTTTKGIFIETEWYGIGDGSSAEEGGVINVTRSFSDILVNSTASGVFSTSNNGLLNSDGEDVVSFLTGDGILLEHDATDNLIRFSTSLNPTLDTSFVLTIAGETVDLNPLTGGVWSKTTDTIHPLLTSDKLGIGLVTATATLDINGNIRVRTVPVSSVSNNVAIINNNNILEQREINSGVWNVTGSFLTGSGTTGYLSVWDSTGSALEDSMIYFDSGNNRIGIGNSIVNPTEVLEVGGAIKLGSATNNTVGSIRWDGNDFTGRISTGWVSLTTAIVDTEEVQDIVGGMFTSNITTGLQMNYNDPTGKVDVSIDSFTINLSGDASGSVIVNWTALTGEYDLAVSLTPTSMVELGTDTTGDYVASITEGIGISVDGTTGEGADVILNINVDDYTIGLANTGNQLEVLRTSGEFNLVPGEGIEILNGNTPYDGSLDLDFEISVKINELPSYNLAAVIDNYDGLSIRVDNETITSQLTTEGWELTAGLLGNNNIENSYIILNGFVVDLGDSIDLELNQLSDVEYGTFGPEVGQILKWSDEGKWVAEDEGLSTVPGIYGNIQITDGFGNLISSDDLRFNLNASILTVLGDIDTNVLNVKNGYFSAPNDYSNKFISAFTETTDQVHTELYTDGIAAEIIPINNSVLSFKIKMTALRSGGGSFIGEVGDVWVHEIIGAVKNIDGALSLVGVITEVTIAEDEFTESWEVLVTADDINDKLKIEVKGEIDTTIRWTAFIELNEIRY